MLGSSWRAAALAALLGALPASRVGAQVMQTASVHLPIQGVARDAADQLIPSGDVAITVYSDSTGPYIWYQANYPGAIVNGIFDVIVGLDPVMALYPTGHTYYLELYVAGSEVIGDAAGGRFRLYLGGGDRERPDFEARLNALESAFAVPPPASMNAGAVAQVNSAYSNQHAMLGVSKVAGSAGGYTATGNLLFGPVGLRGAGGVQVELGPAYLSTPSANPIVRSIRDVPGDQGRSVRVRWRRDLRERPYVASDTQPRVTGYTIYRRVEAGQAMVARPDAGAAPVSAHEPLPEALALPPGEWDVLTTVPATLDTAYQTVVPTLCDSNATAFCRAMFVVRSITDQVGVYHNSLRDSGYSVDNLAPGVPGNLAVTPVAGGTKLTWQASAAPDFQHFRVYRSSDPGFVPGPGTLVQSTIETQWTDLATGAYSYKVTAVDFNGNESVPASATSTTGVGNETPRFLAFASMVPNPFQHSLRFMIAVPEGAELVDLSIFDLAGRRVRTLAHEVLAAGTHPYIWDGRTDTGGRASAGMYVARLTRAGRTVTRRAMMMP